MWNLKGMKGVVESDYGLSRLEVEAYGGVGFGTQLQLVRLRPRLLSRCPGLSESWRVGTWKSERLTGRSVWGGITSIVMCGLGWLGLYKIVSPAKSQKMGLAGPGLGSSPGLLLYKNPVDVHCRCHSISVYIYRYTCSRTQGGQMQLEKFA